MVVAVGSRTPGDASSGRRCKEEACVGCSLVSYSSLFVVLGYKV